MKPDTPPATPPNTPSNTPPRYFPPPPPLAPKVGLFRQTPPAIFPSVLGVIGLGIVWRTAAPALGVPGAIGDVILGAAALLWLFAALAYLAKVARRPGVIGEDLRVLPGQTGLAGATMGLMALSVGLVPVAPALAGVAGLVGFGAHMLLAVAMARRFATTPPEARQVTPAWHMIFVGGILAALTAARLGHAGPAQALMWAETAVASAIWAVSLRDLVRHVPPAPLRPMLTIHAAPAGLLSVVSLETGHEAQAVVFALLALAILCAIALRVRWVATAGFSPLWGGFTFPVAISATAFLSLGGLWLAPAIVALATASVVTPFVASRVLRAWAGGQLGAKTGAAIA